jgi:hypothetical protein
LVLLVPEHAEDITRLRAEALQTHHLRSLAQARLQLVKFLQSPPQAMAPMPWTHNRREFQLPPQVQQVLQPFVQEVLLLSSSFEVTAIKARRQEVLVCLGPAVGEMFLLAFEKVLTSVHGGPVILVREDPDSGVGPHFLVPSGQGPQHMHYDAVSPLHSFVCQLVESTPTAFARDLDMNIHKMISETKLEPAKLGDVFIAITRNLIAAEQQPQPSTNVPAFSCVLFRNETSPHAGRVPLSSGDQRLTLYGQARLPSEEKDIGTSERPLSERTLPVHLLDTFAGNSQAFALNAAVRMQVGSFLLAIQNSPAYRGAKLPSHLKFGQHVCTPFWLWDDELLPRSKTNWLPPSNNQIPVRYSTHNTIRTARVTTHITGLGFLCVRHGRCA